MVKNIVKSSLLVLCLLLCACDASLEIVGMEICAYPNRIVYVAGVDSSLDLTGGKVNYLLKGGSVTEDNMNAPLITVTHDIDFNTPGIYTVVLKRHKGVCQFPIQVIEETAADTWIPVNIAPELASVEVDSIPHARSIGMPALPSQRSRAARYGPDRESKWDSEG